MAVLAFAASCGEPAPTAAASTEQRAARASDVLVALERALHSYPVLAAQDALWTSVYSSPEFDAALAALIDGALDDEWLEECVRVSPPTQLMRWTTEFETKHADMDEAARQAAEDREFDALLDRPAFDGALEKTLQAVFGEPAVKQRLNKRVARIVRMSSLGRELKSAVQLLLSSTPADVLVRALDAGGDDIDRQMVTYLTSEERLTAFVVGFSRILQERSELRDVVLMAVQSHDLAPALRKLGSVLAKEPGACAWSMRLLDVVVDSDASAEEIEAALRELPLRPNVTAEILAVVEAALGTRDIELAFADALTLAAKDPRFFGLVQEVWGPRP